MKIYIAAPYPLREEARRIMILLESAGHHVTSRWIVEDQVGMSHEHATHDLEDVARADLLLAVHQEAWHNRGTGGRHVEFGYALALGIPVVLWGQRTNNFHHLNHVRVIERLEDL